MNPRLSQAIPTYTSSETAPRIKQRCRRGINIRLPDGSERKMGNISWYSRILYVRYGPEPVVADSSHSSSHPTISGYPGKTSHAGNLAGRCGLSRERTLSLLPTLLAPCL